MIQYEGELLHHGVKGMKWGVRRYQNPDGSYTKLGKKKYNVYGDKDVVLAKGAKAYRVSLEKEDKTYDNKKYMSLSRKDNRTWDNYIGKHYRKQGKTTYSNTYVAKEQLKIASSVKAGKIFVDKLLNNPKYKNQTVKDSTSAWNSLNANANQERTAEQYASINFALQTKTGKRIVKELMKQGYHGVVDAHGTNTANLPIIIFDPDKNMVLKKSKAKH